MVLHGSICILNVPKSNSRCDPLLSMWSHRSFTLVVLGGFVVAGAILGIKASNVADFRYCIIVWLSPKAKRRVEVGLGRQRGVFRCHCVAGGVGHGELIGTKGIGTVV